MESATYREGRLSNPLDFSWTWGEFKKYFDDARNNPSKYKLPDGFNIPPLPERWKEENTLNEEDNKWVNKFNKFSFIGDFLGHDPDKPGRSKFWEEFIKKNPDGIHKEEIKIQDENGNPKTEIEETEVEIGEFLQYFWQKKESGQLGNYKGEFESPRIPKTEEVLDNNLPMMSNLTAEFSNALSNSVENLTKEVEAIRIHVQANMNNQNNSLQSEIQKLKQEVGNIRQELYRRN